MSGTRRDRRVFLGFDVGTSSSKGVLTDEEGRVVAEAIRQHEVSSPRTGHFEVESEGWWEEFIAVTHDLRERIPDAVIEAVGVSGMGPCVALADERGRPTRPAILYGIDMRATSQIDELNAALGAAAILDRTGNELSTQSVGPKLRWVQEHEPEVMRRSRRLFMPASYLAFRLTDAYVLDYHSASQCTPLFDPGRGEWCEDWWDEVAGGLQRPRLVWPADIVGHISQEAAMATGIAAGTPVVAGSIDAWTEAVSVGATEVGDLMLMYGTTLFMVATTASRIAHPPLWSTYGVRPESYCVAAGMATSGAITSWLRSLFGSPSYGDLIEEATAAGPGARGLLMLPYFAGERTPINDPDARGVIVGLTIQHSRGDLYRAALEATAMGIRHNLEVIDAAGAPIERVLPAGGGTQGGLWTQVVSDVTGLPQILREVTIGAAYGATRFAAEGTGLATASWNPVRDVVQPNPAVAGVYDDRYARYRELYGATRSIAHALAGGIS